jgi:homoserine O-succinyltransferase
MPILVDRGPGGCSIVAGKGTAAERLEARRHPAGSEWIEIGLVNNMPEAALEATEQQFLELIGAAAGDSWVHLRFFSLPGVPRSERGRSYLSQSYHDAADLRRAELDGLIVTGTEPKAADLADEPYWGAFTQLVDWAARNTISTVWSCLAAHAAVLHLDGIARVPLREKCIGVFACDTPAEHPLTQNLPSRPTVPHARWNELPQDALVANGYQVLTCSPAAGVDTFVRQNFGRQNFGGPEQSLFLFFQGHPEYGAGALLSEFRRDVGRFLKGERDRYPAMPQHYFDAATEAELAAFRQRAECQRGEELLAEFPVPANPALVANWQPFAVTIYRNWLSILSAQKQRLQRPARYMAALRLDQTPAPAG